MDKYSEFLEKLRETEFGRLSGETYLDHAGSGLYCNTHLQKHFQDLQNKLYANPHSGGVLEEIIDQVRSTVLQFFNVTSEEYDIIFTSGATNSLQLLGRIFPWQSGSTYAYLQDNHTSVVGIREIAYEKGANVYCLFKENGVCKSFKNLDQYSWKLIKKNISSSVDDSCKVPCLFAYPAQSNFSGTKYPHAWVDNVHHTIFQKPNNLNNKWFVLCDAAAFVGTSHLDLQSCSADFVVLSFYKIFGFPTGLGALLVKKEVKHILTHKSYFGGGSVSGWLATKDYFLPKPELHDRYEDGTLPFLSILAVKHGFDTFHQLGLTMPVIQNHTFQLIKHAYASMEHMKHHNGFPVIKMYTDTDCSDKNEQGPILAFNVFRSDGSCYGYKFILQLASSHNLHMRGGCFCNMGACARHLQISSDVLMNAYKAGHVCGDNMDVIDGKPIGAVRLSLGYGSTANDIENVLDFLANNFVERQAEEEEDVYYDAESGDKDVILQKIFVYPVKSCQGMEVDNWKIEETGLQFDRVWMIVNEHNVCVNLKMDSKLLKITPKIDIFNKCLTLSFEGLEDISIPFIYNNANNDHDVTTEHCLSKVCRDQIFGFNCGTAVNDWLTTALGYPCSLLQKDFKKQRFLKQRFRNPKIETGRLSLANEAQYLLINHSSVEYLKSKMSNSTSAFSTENWMKRFRANFVISGAGKFDEDSWIIVDFHRHTETESETMGFSVCGLCSRCSMICVDPDNGNKTNEPLKALANLICSENKKRKPTFGVYLQCHDLHGQVTTGSKLTVKKKSM